MLPRRGNYRYYSKNLFGRKSDRDTESLALQFSTFLLAESIEPQNPMYWRVGKAKKKEFDCLLAPKTLKLFRKSDVLQDVNNLKRLFELAGKHKRSA